MSEELRELVESSDLAGLTRYVDRVTRESDWEHLVDIAERCREAVARGKQLWGVAHYADYRLALNAPVAYAAAVVGDDSATFTLGPLWEVTASTHSWEELEPHLGAPVSRALAAHERVIRGDNVDPASLVAGDAVTVPLRLLDWEPKYPTAVFRTDGADFPEIEGAAKTWMDLPEPGAKITDDDVPAALLDVVRPWWEESSGRAVTATVEGTAFHAIAALGPRRARVVSVSLEEALGAMCWAGASGGAYGKRRGSPIGRDATWWALASALGFDEPPDDPEWGREGRTLEWVLWDPGDQTGGWSLHLAIADPQDGIAWALSAVDMK